jgi:hypothetical protein
MNVFFFSSSFAANIIPIFSFLVYITLPYYISFLNHLRINSNPNTNTHTNPTTTTTTTNNNNNKVARLYRNSLKLVSSWCIDRDIFNDKATEIRGQFDDERGCRPEKAIRLLRVS